MTDRYYELHITMVGEPAIIQPAVEAIDWKFSQIDGDPVEGLGVKCYATTHLHAGTPEGLVLGELQETADDLAENPGVEVTRQKIELVVHDTKSSKIRLSAPDPASCDVRNLRQDQTHAWCTAVFGESHATSLRQRGVRMMEEAIELAQTCHVPREMIHRLVDFVYEREVGEFRQEMGGLGVTLLCLAGAAGVSADECEDAEVQRILSKDPLHFRQRNEEKNAAGFDTEAYLTT